MNADEEHLQLLAIFHYIVAALAGLFSLFPVYHFFLGLRMLAGHLVRGRAPDPFTAIMGWMFVFFAGFAMICGMAYAVSMAVAAANLTQRRHYTFCLVMACISCLLMPVGTILGVLTIIVLLRPSVRQRFGVPNAVPPPRPSSDGAA